MRGIFDFLLTLVGKNGGFTVPCVQNLTISIKWRNLVKVRPLHRQSLQ